MTRCDPGADRIVGMKEGHATVCRKALWIRCASNAATRVFDASAGCVERRLCPIFCCLKVGYFVVARSKTIVPLTRPQSPVRLSRRLLWGPASLVGFVLLWLLAVRLTGLPEFILPGPLAVAERLVDIAADGTLWRHTWATLSQLLLGLALGLSVAFGLGYAIARSRRLERALTPYIVASQAVPVVALAPLFVIWFGSGLLAKALICALIVFFPALVNTLVGLRGIAPELRDLLRVYRATPWQTLITLEIPAALPVLIGGLKIGATLAVIGAVVGEYVGSDRGLGYLINFARGTYDTPLVIAGVLTLVALALALYGAVAWLEARTVGWARQPEH